MGQGQAGGEGAGGNGAQRQLQGAQTEASCHDQAVGGTSVIDSFITPIGPNKHDNREEAMARASRKPKGIQFSSTQLNSCNEFRDLSTKHKGCILKKQIGCTLFTIFVCKIDRCYQKRQNQIATTCGVKDSNKVSGQEHHPILHPSKSRRTQ